MDELTELKPCKECLELIKMGHAPGYEVPKRMQYIRYHTPYFKCGQYEGQSDIFACEVCQTKFIGEISRQDGSRWDAIIESQFLNIEKNTDK